MGISSSKKVEGNCVCMMNIIPKIKNIDYNTGEITFICKKEGDKTIPINDFFQKKESLIAI